MADVEKYTPEEQEQIRKNWKGEPPPCCVGKCDLKTFHLDLICKACGWCDDSLPVTGSQEY